MAELVIGSAQGRWNLIFQVAWLGNAPQHSFYLTKEGKTASAWAEYADAKAQAHDRGERERPRYLRHFALLLVLARAGWRRARG